jgi:putative transcriptional regulator
MMNIKEIRNALGISQAEFARRVGVDVGTVSRWERGEVRPSQLAQQKIDELEKVAMR